MLLTSSQVSFIISTVIIVTFTLALFLAGYVLQQQTVRSLTAEIKPRVHARAQGYSQLHGLSLPTQFATTARTMTAEEVAATTSLVLDSFGDFSDGGMESVQGQSDTVLGSEENWFELEHGNGRDEARRQPVAALTDEWRSRLRSDDDEFLTKGQEQFEAEGDDFFAPKKKAERQIRIGGGRR